MLTSTTKALLVTGFLTVATLTLGSAPAVAADGGGDCQEVIGCDQGSPQTDGGTVTVTVTSSFGSNGSPGSGDKSTSTVKVSPPWYYIEAMPGEDYFHYVDSGLGDSDWNHNHIDDQGGYKPSPGYEDHKDDEDGIWYAPAGNSSVTVDAKRDKVTFSATSAGNVACQDGGTEWTHGASSDCVLHFRRAGSTPVTATANWDLNWSANGEDQGALDPITATQTAPINVIEVQNIVTDIG